jgi:putative 4-mercaptohistidine N1-methyltranferase
MALLMASFMANPYETERLLAEYLLFHYGGAEEILGGRNVEAFAPALGFPARTVAHFAPGETTRGLDLGCAVGRSTFEMARHCREVTGIDFSRAFIQAAESLRRGEKIPYRRLEEGHVSTELIARAPADLDPARVRFETGDAMALRDDLGSFDRVHAANLLCRLPEPQRLLNRLPALVRPGGELVLATPCTWLAEFTPPENWPPASTFDWLKKELGPHFDFADQADEPFLIRETARKFQFTDSLVTVWRRK